MCAQCASVVWQRRSIQVLGQVLTHTYSLSLSLSACLSCSQNSVGFILSKALNICHYSVKETIGELKRTQRYGHVHFCWQARTWGLCLLLHSICALAHACRYWSWCKNVKFRGTLSRRMSGTSRVPPTSTKCEKFLPKYIRMSASIQAWCCFFSFIFFILISLLAVFRLTLPTNRIPRTKVRLL